jgi:hypothetical protein
MKKTLFIVLLFFIAACSNSSSEEKKAKQLVKLYLDSLNHKINGYEIIGYEDFHPIFTTVEDDPNYEKYKNNSSKLDGIKEKYVPKIRAWVIYATFKGRDNYGNFGKHFYQCVVDKKLSKCIVAIEVNNLP